MQKSTPVPVIVTLVLTVWPSTVTDTVATPAETPAVKTPEAVPASVVANGGAIEPCGVVAKPTGMPSGTEPEPEVSTPSEFMVKRAVIADVCPGPIEDGTAVILRTSHGLKSTLPVTVPHPPPPGPALHPHQLVS